MERLTFRNDYGVALACDVSKYVQQGIERLATYEDAGLTPEECTTIAKSYPKLFDMVEELQRYKDAEAEGRLIILPCKVGDVVWNRKIEPYTVVSIEWFSRKVTQLHCKSPVTGRGNTFSVGRRSLGKTVFLTREEAERALGGIE